MVVQKSRVLHHLHDDVHLWAMADVVVLSLGGSLVATPSPNIDYVHQIADMLAELHKQNIHVHVVVGGGAIARQYIGALRATSRGLSEQELNDRCDLAGIWGTRMNASLLQCALGDLANPTIPTETESQSVKPNLLTVMGGTHPGQTTDAVCVKLARAIGCKKVINATNVPGVYAKNPKEFPGLPMLEKITHDDLISIVGTHHSPGINTVIDPVAAGILKEENITCFVLDGSNLDNMKQCLLGETFIGTTIG
ncbi:putative Uridylate kinase [Blattamonas nauphoetae]|uniref:Uridylate kinase n=1 Tax=Blattamonas nauphoetae TaxID=2049346 RepID=A0ABQ9YEK7_9EUKA|nr:putative Uridylate kinase [Blattamonas nauphoetae]